MFLFLYAAVSVKLIVIVLVPGYVIVMSWFVRLYEAIINELSLYITLTNEVLAQTCRAEVCGVWQGRYHAMLHYVQWLVLFV